MRRVTNGMEQLDPTISIHSSQTGWDYGRFDNIQEKMRISIHSSQTGWDFSHIVFFLLKFLFQSTHPKRDETDYLVFEVCPVPISIHSSQTGWDWRSTCTVPVPYSISIHSSQTGWDSCSILSLGSSIDFNPLIPNGMRPTLPHVDKHIQYFNPLIPNGMRLLTLGLLHRKYGNFNPLIPNGMRPVVYWCLASVPYHFNPLIPNGMRHYMLRVIVLYTIFQSTHPKRDETF